MFLTGAQWMWMTGKIPYNNDHLLYKTYSATCIHKDIS